MTRSPAVRGMPAVVTVCRLPRTRVGHGDLPRPVDAIHLDVKTGARADVRDACFEAIAPGGRDGDGVLQPLAGPGPAHVVSAIRVAGRLDIDVRRSIRSPFVSCRRVVIRDALCTNVEVLRLHEARKRGRPAAVRRCRVG
jgi:hypothetical protein